MRAKAQSTVQAAVAGGVILNNADNAYMRHDANYVQPIGNMLNRTEAANFYLAKPFVDQLKNTDDPRLSAIAIRYKGATSGPAQTVAIGTTDPADQIGMPMGFDNGTIVARATADGLASFYDYSQVDRRRVAKNTAPMFFVTAAQTQLLLAEAKLQGLDNDRYPLLNILLMVSKHIWIKWPLMMLASAVPAAARDAYMAANPLMPGTELATNQYTILDRFFFKRT